MLGGGIGLAERGVVPTMAIRGAIRALCRQRLASLTSAPTTDAFLATIAGGPVAELTELANSQHYELPAAFFAQVLGPHRKYSSAIWPEPTTTLEEAEAEMLDLTCRRAALRDGETILELGCGWGSLSTFMARRYPNSRIVAVSNSASQRRHILAAGLPNLEVITADMNRFDPGERFDRIVSVEMFEHMRDWPELLSRVASWLRDDGTLFVHVFCHARHPYLFDREGSDNWMGRYFFSGGMMPSYDLLPLAAEGLLLGERWWVPGRHYQRTAAAWRENLERRRTEVLTILTEHYGDQATRWYHRWRIFFLACEELFGFAGGAEWGVGHYRFSRDPGAGTGGRAR